MNEKEIFINNRLINQKENSKIILEEDYSVMRDITQNQPIKITSDGNVSIIFFSLKFFHLLIYIK